MPFSKISKQKNDPKNTQKQKLSKAIRAEYILALRNFSVRNLLIHLHRKNRSQITDPPPNKKMRYTFYWASYLFIDGTSQKKQPLSSCVMAICRLRYPSNDGVYVGFIFS